MDDERVREFFSVARERHSIYLRRAAGLPRPWTEDPILDRFRFTNVFRELDRTTSWFRKYVRGPLRDSPEVLLATVVFRLFNRITTGEAIFLQPALGLGGELPGETAWGTLLRTGDVSPMRASILQYCGDGPYVTGAFIVKTPEGLTKLDGVLDIIEHFIEGRRLKRNAIGWREMAEWWLQGQNSTLLRWSLQEAHNWLESHYFIGHFQAYEFVTDLRHTALQEHAPDIMTWANPGPGATRGLNYLSRRERTPRREQLIEEMQQLLEMSRDPEYWPRWFPESDPTKKTYEVGDYRLPNSPNAYEKSSWPTWELREVEMWCCEMLKYWRFRDGGSRPRGVYR